MKTHSNASGYLLMRERNTQAFLGRAWRKKFIEKIKLASYFQMYVGAF
jgi:hypothetical protein